MPKIKTHKGLQKKLRIKQSGLITIGHPGGRHNLGKKSQKVNREKRKESILSKADSNRFKKVLRGGK